MLGLNYSKSQIETLKANSGEAKEVLDALRIDIQERLMQSIRPALSEIITELNSMGHSFATSEADTSDCVKYGEEIRLAEGSMPGRLLVAADLVITVAYPVSDV